MAHIHLGLVFHQHQPVGNFDFVFEELFQNSYDPLLAGLERHPGVKAGLHYSGPLLDWLRANRPAYLTRIRELVDIGQVEVLGGAYYEPILPAISGADRVGQMTKMRAEVARLFGRAPAGMWLAERVWEPDLPRSIAAAGYRWTIVDDVHFEGAGVRPEELGGWRLTEDQGATLGVFGSNTNLRYLVPWGTVEATTDALRAHGDRHPGGLITMGDDGEKFGGWPTTFKHCWDDGWVDAFFSRLEAESHWIETVHLSDWQAERPPEGLVYLPAVSYMEMGEWSLPAEEQHALQEAKRTLRQAGREDLTRFIRGGHWRNFLARYPEVTLHRARVARLSAEANRRHDETALDLLWQAQCNCAFWHGVFGGVYLEHIRHANFANAVKADALLYPGPQPAERGDFDADGAEEICLRSADHAVVIDPATGEILHWDLRAAGWHLTHALARRPEAYHRDLESGREEGVRSIHDGVRVKDAAAVAESRRYDRGLRVAAQDTLFPRGMFSREGYADSRLAARPQYALVALTDGAVSLTDAGNGIAKEIAIGDGLRASYGVATAAGLASEWNLSLPEWPGEGAPCFEPEPGLLTIRGGGLTLRARHTASECWHERIYSASNTEHGVELAPQGWCIVFFFAGGAGSIGWSVDQ